LFPVNAPNRAVYDPNMRFSEIRFAFAVASLLAVAVVVAGCGAGSEDGDGGAGGTEVGSGPGGTGSTGSGFTGGSTGSGMADDCLAEAKLIYLVSVDYELYSFDPTIAGTAAYNLVGPLSCASGGAPQSMAVSRDGTAYVFYDTGELFRVSTTDASCQSTSYVHPVQQGFNQLGMGFTAASEGSKDEVLYIVSPAFGLATVAFPSFQVSQTGALVGAAELTGGPDAKLFHFAAANAALGEIGLPSYSLSPMHVFSELSGTGAWAFSRYAGKFYLFTSPGDGFPSTTTEYDPVTDSSTTRDTSIGFTVVGAGQSTCVPPPPPM
jgi:hypothetical protein